VLAALTGAGLSAAAGLNAFIPFLLVGMLDRFTTLIDLAPSLEWISSWWAIGIAMVLLVADVVFDKVPGVDHVSDVIQTGVRPLMGGVMFAAASGAEQVEQSQWWRDNPWVAVVIGIALAGTVHAGKALSRPLVNAGTLGLGTPFVSAAEDASSATVSIVAILAPILVVIVLVVIGYVLYRLFRARRRRAARAEMRIAPRPEPPPM
jgi:peptidoglycan/LPS O-acetylase OafA/YrhL